MKEGRNKKPHELDMRRYDWSKATRGRFASRFLRSPGRAPVAVRILSDDLVVAFPDSESVHAALRSILAAAKRIKTRRGRSKKAA
jgi:hypothetical protein